jgi:hypothetical protein
MTLRRRFTSVCIMAFAALVMALPAFATSHPEEAVETALTDAAASATSIVLYGIPVILGVAILWVGLKFGKRLIGRL